MKKMKKIKCWISSIPAVIGFYGIGGTMTYFPHIWWAFPTAMLLILAGVVFVFQTFINELEKE